MTREEKEQTSKYVLQMARLLEDGCYQQEMLLKAVHIIDEALEQQKTGHWIRVDKDLQRYKCSECGEVIRLYKKSEIPILEKDETLFDYPFSHCGCKMNIE